MPRYRSRFYAVNVPIPLPDPPNPMPAGTGNTASVTVQNYPFLMKRVGHAIIGRNQVLAGPITGLADVSQDGQYTVRFRTDSSNYMNVPLSALAAFGGGQFSQIVDLPAPIELKPKETIIVEVSTSIPRQLGIEVQIIFEGVEPYDPQPEPQG